MRYDKLWVIINFEGVIQYSTLDKMHLDMMRDHVARANQAGENWKLLEFSLEREIVCGAQLKHKAVS